MPTERRCASSVSKWPSSRPIPPTSLSSMPIADRYPWLTRKRALVALGATTLGFTIALYLLDPHVQGYGAASINDFEFAGSSSRAAQIVAEWGTEGRRLAHLGLLLDYGYMLSY